MLALLIGVGAGLVLGLTGAGGSVLALPLLVTGLGLLPAQAAGVSLGVVALAAIVGTVLQWRARQMVWPAVASVGMGAMLVAPVGQWMAGQLSPAVFLILFMMVAVLVSVRLWRQAGTAPAETRIVRAGVWSGGLAAPACARSASGGFEWRWPCVQRMALAGALTGFLSGLFGVGGGFVIVPALVLLMGLPMVQAVASSLAIISVVSLTGFVAYAWQAPALPLVMGPLWGGSFLGMLAGTWLAPRVAGPWLQRGFALLMLAAAAFMLLHFFLSPV